jgi:glycoside/pentoside/hexuronide:cation symporter, GPH family
MSKIDRQFRPEPLPGAAASDGNPPPYLDSTVDPQTALATDTKLPRFFSTRYATRGIAMGVNIVVLAQLTFYATDIVGLPAALVGGLFLAAKIIDAIADLPIGFLIDRTKTRWGKARPYELFVIPMWLLTVAAFSVPDMSQFWQATYIFVMFVLITSVCQTFLMTSEAVYLKRSLRGEVKYAKVISRQGVIIIFFSAAAAVLLPQLMATWGTEPGGYTKITLLYAIPLTIIGLVRFFTIKELPEDETDHVTEERLGVRATFRALLANRYVLIMAAILMLSSIVSAIGAATGTYFFKYILGDLGLASFAGIGTAVIPLVLLLFPVAVRTIGAMNFARVGLVLAMAGYGMVAIAPTNVPVVLLGVTLQIFTAVLVTLASFFLIQTMTYGEWKTGQRIDAVTNSLQGFASQFGQGIAIAVVGVVIGAAGYNGLAEVQSPAVKSTIIVLYSLVPLVLSGIMLGLTYLYKLDKQIPAIQADLAAGVNADTSSIKI